MLLLILIQSCIGCKYLKEFSICNNDEMIALITPDNCENQKEYVVTNLPCNFSCPSGSYLDLNITTNALQCSLCDPGSYSIGGGIQLTSQTIKTAIFKSYCWTMEEFGWEISEECTPWHDSPEWAFVSGTTRKDSWYEADIYLYETLVKPGLLEVIYRKESSSLDGWNFADFYIVIDGHIELFDYKSGDSSWKNFTHTLTAGMHEIRIVFEKFVTKQYAEAQIKEIQIRGTSYASSTCEICYDGYSPAGSDKCIACDAGSYLSNNLCISCPLGYSSFPNSNSEADCFEMKACTDQDYHYYYSECESGYLSKVYEWNTPLICNNTGIKLPDLEDSDCLPCPSGMFYQGSICESCPSGYYITDTSYGNTCTQCPLGHYAPKIREYSEWTKIPFEFNTACISSLQYPCSYSWETRGTYLITSPIYIKDSSIVLQTRANITESSAYVEYFYTIKGANTNLTCYIDGILSEFSIGDNSDRKKVLLKIGEHNIKWICQHSNQSDESCSFSNISIYGSSTGGASNCYPCNEGYFSSNSTDSCNPCTPGSTSNDLRTGCVACQAGYFSNSPGPCKACPGGTISNSENTNCISLDLLSIGTSTFAIGDLSGQQGKIPYYCTLDRFMKYCHQTFYGPTEGNNNYFYLSVINPSTLLMPSYSEVSNLQGYAYGIIDKAQLTLPEQQILKPDDNCSKDYSRIIINLGSELESVSKIDNGFSVNYINGDYCDDSNAFSTVINFSCDKNEKEGWPQYIGFNNCKFEFSWPTINACEICNATTMTESRGRCHHGKRTIHYFEGPNCTMTDPSYYKTATEHCNMNHVFGRIPFIIAMILTILLLVIVGIAIFKAFKKRSEYHKLIQFKADGRNIEMQGK